MRIRTHKDKDTNVVENIKGNKKKGKVKKKTSSKFRLFFGEQTFSLVCHRGFICPLGHILPTHALVYINCFIWGKKQHTTCINCLSYKVVSLQRTNRAKRSVFAVCHECVLCVRRERDSDGVRHRG